MRVQRRCWIRADFLCGVIQNKVKNYIYATLVTFFNKLVEIVERTEVGINIVIIFNIILMI